MTLYCVIFSLLRRAHVLKQWTIDLNLITLLCCLQLTEKGHMFLNNKQLIWILWLCIVMSSAYWEGSMFHKQWTIHLNLMTLYCVIFILLRRAHFHKQWTIDLNVMSLICIFFSLVRRRMVFLNRTLTPKRKVSQSWQPEEVLTPFYLILYLFVLSSFTCYFVVLLWRLCVLDEEILLCLCESLSLVSRCSGCLNPMSMFVHALTLVGFCGVVWLSMGEILVCGAVMGISRQIF
jgi:hypothetical protein